MSDLSKQVNIGKELETKLIKVGISSFEELKRTGAEKAFLKIQKIDSGACLSLLNAIEGAILGLRWHNLPTERKQELIQFFKKNQFNNRCEE